MEPALIEGMAATILRLALLAVTIIIPGGFLLIPAYLAYRAHRRAKGNLDFDQGSRRAPALKAPPPDAHAVRRVLRKLSRYTSPLPG